MSATENGEIAGLLEPGTVVGGRFLVRGLLGSGGMGHVYLALHQELSRKVALKVLRPDLGVTPARALRFQREAKATSRINHRNSVVVYDYGEWEGVFFLAMEYIEGRPLDEVMLKDYPIAAERAVNFALQVCDALEVAHEHGVIHRDLKPENVLVIEERGEEVVKVVDFGLAVLLDDADPRLTREGTTAGTPAYMSPEQARGKLPDGRSDLYSLGVLLYELLSGVVPFDGDVQEILMKHLLADPPLPSERNPHVAVHPALEAFLAWTLAKAADGRPQSARAFSDELKNAFALSQSPEDLRQGRKGLLGGGDRQQRATVAGLGPTPGGKRLADAPTSSAPSSAQDGVCLVIESEAGKDFGNMASACLRANGVEVRRLAELGEEALAEGDERVVVFDIRHDADGCLAQLAEMVDGDGCLAGRPLIVVGPEDSVEPMARALEIGVQAYVPQSKLVSNLPRAVSRVLRKKKKKGKQ